MKKYDVAYVPNGPFNYYPSVPLQDMSLEEIVKKYIKTCAKANGNISVCSKCKTPCSEGARAIQLKANEVYNDPPVPLYGGKTLIERAREENIKRREERDKIEAEKKKAEEQVKTEKKKRKYIQCEDWWEKSLASGDQVKWLCDTFGLSKTQAKSKIYNYKWSHGMAGSSVEKKTETKTSVVEKAIENGPVIKIEQEMPQNESIEGKMDLLMKQQESHKKLMQQYQELYEKEKKKYEEIGKKIDILCNAMDILNDN